MLSDKESDFDWERHGMPVADAIGQAAEVSDEIAQDVLSILQERHEDFEAAKSGEESEFGPESHYEELEADDSEWRADWEHFERSLKTEARFFNSAGSSHLAAVFGHIDKIRTLRKRPLVRTITPGSKSALFFRARVFQSDDALKTALGRPDLHLGPPPPALATPGRMNAAGISVFYGATTRRLAIAEVRPPVGSQVLVGRFDVLRPLRLLDLTALASVVSEGSIFDPGWAARLERAAFLGSLKGRISQPVMPDDERLEYLATQAVADFLATQNKPTFDGMIFPSVQAGGAGRNVVLFHRASRVREMQLPTGITITAEVGMNTSDGWERDYVVYEQLPRSKPNVEGDEGLAAILRAPLAFEGMDSRDPHEESLEVNLESLQVHVVHSVRVKTTPHNTRRHRFPAPNDEDF